MDVSSHRSSRRILLVLLIANLVALISSSFYSNQSTKAISAIVIGDIIVGGLFPVHEKGQGNTPCGEINLDRGIQRLETMLFTIDQINNNERVLPGIKLGASIYDTCARETYALEQSLEFVRASISTLDASEFECEDGSKAKIKSVPTAVAGVIGGSYSSVSIQVANLLRLFRIPQISYASTSAALSDTSRFDYFVRTVPPDTFQARALVDIIQFFNWTYVATVSSEGNYGESGISYLHQEARAKNICIATTEKIPAKSNAHTFDTIIHNLKIKANARVVVLFVRVEDAKRLLNAATKANTTDRFVWVAADGWGREEAPVENNQISASGALTIELQSQNIGPFDDYFQNLNPTDNIRNPWFKEYWEKVHNCHLSKKSALHFRKPCSGHERITPNIYKQESKVQFIYDAVYAMADSLHRMQKDLCPNTDKLCDTMAKINGELLLNKYIMNTSFSGK